MLTNSNIRQPVFGQLVSGTVKVKNPSNGAPLKVSLHDSTIDRLSTAIAEKTAAATQESWNRTMGLG